MAKALYLVSRSHAAHIPQANGVRAVLINADDAAGSPAIRLLAASKLAGVDPAQRANYFDTITKVDDLTAGPLKDNGDCLIITGAGNVQKVEG